jgi:hypothetical protein
MSDSTEWQVYDWENDRVRGVTRDELYDLSEKVRATDPVTDDLAYLPAEVDELHAAQVTREFENGEYADLTNAEAYDWPTDLEVAPTPHEWQVDGRAATPAELQDWGARVRAGEHRPEARPVTLPSEATAKAAVPVAQAAFKARLTQ